MENVMILLVEEPTFCGECQLCTIGDLCAGFDFPRDIIDISDKPLWCPLKPTPARKKPMNKKGYKSGYIEGWNDAIDSLTDEERRSDETD